MKKSLLLQYIKTRPNWRAELAAEPYFLRIKDDPPYTIIKYTQGLTDFYYPFCREARGIILKNADTDPQIVCYGFDKFFRADEPFAAQINPNCATYLEKVDGTNIRLWYDEGQWRISTLFTINAFDTGFGQMVEKCLGRPIGQFADENLLDKTSTHIFEFVSSERRIIVNYPEPALYAIGRRYLPTLEEREPQNMEPLIRRPRHYTATTPESLKLLLSSLDKQRLEGLVAVDQNYNRVKLKTEWYWNLSYIFGGELGRPSPQTLFRAFKDGTLNAYYEVYPEVYYDFMDKLKKWGNLADKIDLTQFATKKELSLSLGESIFASYYYRKWENPSYSFFSWLRGLTQKYFMKLWESWKMVKLIIMVGLPGAGKSTYAQTLIDDDGHTEIVSTDQIRKEYMLPADAPVWDIAYQRTANLLEGKTNVVFDATMLSAKRRRGLINFCRTSLKHIYLEIEAIIVWAPIATCIERRKGTIPREAIVRMAKCFSPPTHFEGFDEITMVLGGAKKRTIEEMLDEMKGFDQKSPYHSLSLDEHCLKCADLLKREKKSIQIAGLLHDYGKLYTKKGNADGTYSFPGHAGVSAWEILGADTPYNMFITSILVAEHMNMYRDDSRVKERLSPIIYEYLVKLHEADAAAH